VPRIATGEFEQIALRVHDVMRGVPIHDVWAVDLPALRTGVTLEAFRRAAGGRTFTPSRVVRALFGLRHLVGRIFGWDAEPTRDERDGNSFAARLTPADRAGSLAAPGVRQGPFRLVYRFENEELLEAINRTVHGAVSVALVESARSYRLYVAVYVRDVSRFTPIYLALIEPFRRWIVYPSILRSVRRSWRDVCGS
jgi:hypothetical protein